MLHVLQWPRWRRLGEHELLVSPDRSPGLRAREPIDGPARSLCRNPVELRCKTVGPVPCLLDRSCPCREALRSASKLCPSPLRGEYGEGPSTRHRESLLYSPCAPKAGQPDMVALLVVVVLHVRWATSTMLLPWRRGCHPPGRMVHVPVGVLKRGAPLPLSPCDCCGPLPHRVADRGTGGSLVE